MTDLKASEVCNVGRQKCYGLAVTSLEQLKIKVPALIFIYGSVTVVLVDDGTIVEDEDYFLCLPANMKFMLLHDKETWSPAHQIDRRTAGPSRDSAVDNVDGAESWHSLAEQLRQDLARIILMSEADLQSLIDVPCSDLASALGFSQKKTQVLQDTLQRMLDRREEERQSKELLLLYLKAMEQEVSQEPLEESRSMLKGWFRKKNSLIIDSPLCHPRCVFITVIAAGSKLNETDGVQVESVAGFSSRTLKVLKDKTQPETRFSNEELQMVLRQGVEVMVEVLGWDSEWTAALVQACEGELCKRPQQFQALQSLSAQRKSTLQPQNEGETRVKLHK
ncbi:DNA fragmentation factor subunit alpha-like [Myxocyprinus asiaticus]|uniref:DNA fragmentation factor subunit alpha-like n=1 Tax=Myxocyprinus asiaticus TaxID=70543 RepID=UPI002222CB7C|nr:DNA fragmentation factor subunit alpha-like [Myxocyprinus asiaticus]